MTSTPLSSSAAPHVVKLGGSLLDMADLLERFRAWARTHLGARGVILVGGGDAADAVRNWHARFSLTQERSHWLAVRAMTFNAHLVAASLPDAALVASVEECRHAWSAGRWALVDPFPWLQAEEDQGVTIPHRWSFTSDSIAAHLAQRLGASQLTLLKSTLPDAPAADAAACAQLGIVDADFPAASANLPLVQLVNLRAAGHAVQRLR